MLNILCAYIDGRINREEAFSLIKLQNDSEEETREMCARVLHISVLRSDIRRYENRIKKIENMLDLPDDQRWFAKTLDTE